jgi:hypothetical protein
LHSQALKNITKILFAWKQEAGSWIFIGNLCRTLNVGCGARSLLPAGQLG